MTGCEKREKWVEMREKDEYRRMILRMGGKRERKSTGEKILGRREIRGKIEEGDRGEKREET